MFTPGDHIVFCADRDAAMVAFHGIVLLVGPEPTSKTLVFLPHFNRYLFARNESLIQLEPGSSAPVPFAEIVFHCCTADRCDGTYRRVGKPKCTFEFTRSSDDVFGFDIRGEITSNGSGLARSHLEIRVPQHITFEIEGCINILRQVLGLEYSRCLNADANSKRR